MAFVNVVVWRPRPGTAARLEEILVEMVRLTRLEPGCVLYQAHRSADQDGTYLIYEQFADRAAFDLHNEADYFKRMVLGEALPMLESRERTFYTTEGFD